MKVLAVVVLSAWAGLAGALTARAQSITTIYSFTNSPTHPDAPLAVGPDGNFYGTTSSGGTGNGGTVFQVTTNGTLITLVNFNTPAAQGSTPQAGLTLGPDGKFYGTTYSGGTLGGGTVFQVTTNGTLTTLVNFSYFDITNGAQPAAGLTLGPDGNFYGTTQQGGSGDYGTVFKATTNGVLTTLVSFNGTNGINPDARLALGPDGNFYGTTLYGGGTNLNLNNGPGNGIPPLRPFPGSGNEGYGTVFQVTTQGVLTTLAIFDNTNGAFPHAGLTLGPDGNFYGTTSELYQAPPAPGAPGRSPDGTVFKITTNGTLTTLITFYSTNGANPEADLELGPDGNLYGTTRSGGSTGNGTVFMVTTNGTWTTLLNLEYYNGSFPDAGLTLGPDGNFYGTTEQGGSGGLGTVFQLTTNGILTTLDNFKNANGSGPSANLTLGPDGNFYGTTRLGAMPYRNLRLGGTEFILNRAVLVGVAQEARPAADWLA